MVANKALVVDKRVDGGAVWSNGNIVQSKSVIGVCAEAFGCVPWRMRVYVTVDVCQLGEASRHAVTFHGGRAYPVFVGEGKILIVPYCVEVRGKYGG